MRTLTIETRRRVEFVDVTRLVSEAVGQSGMDQGAVLVFVPHTTAGLTINENADPDVQRDLLLAFEAVAPDLKGFRHVEGNSDAHARSSLVGCSLLVPVESGDLVLGQWQGIYFCEFDGPRLRRLTLQFLGTAP